MNKKEELGKLKRDNENLNRKIEFLDAKVDRMNETIASLNNRLYHAMHPQTLREFMKSIEKQIGDRAEILFVVDFENHRFGAKSCKDFEKYYGKKLLDNSIVAECKQINGYKKIEYVIDAEAKGDKNE